jgi:parallel beta-helix repeat protein
LPSNTILEGEGDQTILRAVPDFRGSRFITNREFLGSNTNIVLRDFRVEIVMSSFLIGDAPGILRFENVNNLEIKNLTMMIDSIMYGIDLSGNTNNAIVEKCAIINQGHGGGIMIRNRYPSQTRATSDIRVRHNRIVSFHDEPLAVFGWLGQVQNVIIENNYVNADGAAFGVSAFGIDSPTHTGSLSDVRIEQNIVMGGKHGAIGIKGGAKIVVVKENKITGAGGDGIFMHTGGARLPEVSDIIVIGNEISDTGRHGILATGLNILIENNRIDKVKGSGIYVSGSNQVIGNEISNARPGILVDGNLPIVIRRNKLTGGDILNLNKAQTVIEQNRIIQ